MLDFIRGKVFKVKPDRVVIDVGGLGFSVRIPVRLSEKLSDTEEVFLYTYLSIKEESSEIYGFIDAQDREIFEELVKISGIGPRIAMNILSTYSRDSLIEIIEQENLKALSKIPSVGKKTAQRIILELKGVLTSLSSEKDQKFDDVLSALINLGYKKTEAKEALEKIYKKEKDEASLIRESLSILSGKHGE